MEQDWGTGWRRKSVVDWFRWSLIGFNWSDRKSRRTHFIRGFNTHFSIRRLIWLNRHSPTVVLAHICSPNWPGTQMKPPRVMLPLFFFKRRLQLPSFSIFHVTPQSTIVKVHFLQVPPFSHRAQARPFANSLCAGTLQSCRETFYYSLFPFYHLTLRPTNFNQEEEHNYPDPVTARAEHL
jgi:hypothetical protein